MTVPVASELMTVREIARACQVGADTVRYWFRTGKLAGVKMAGRGQWRAKREDVQIISTGVLPSCVICGTTEVVATVTRHTGERMSTRSYCADHDTAIRWFV